MFLHYNINKKEKFLGVIMKLHEILPTSRTFYLSPEDGDALFGTIKIILHYDAPMMTVETLAGTFHVNLKTRKIEKDPAKIVIQFTKNDLLERMNVQQQFKPEESYAATMKAIDLKCKELNIVRNHTPSNVYDKMMSMYNTYSPNYSFNALIEVIKEDSELNAYAEELIQKVYTWPELHESIAEAIIKYLYPALKTSPSIPHNAFIIEYPTPN
jgi:hypothetical protein